MASWKSMAGCMKAKREELSDREAFGRVGAHAPWVAEEFVAA